ncbi:hypothetical protein GXW82_14390 [Streptacidiphilus sp. 4-A2]|nr:hypothetical protein [Streptacidiphilus sp. 4-A2]
MGLLHRVRRPAPGPGGRHRHPGLVADRASDRPARPRSAGPGGLPPGTVFKVLPGDSPRLLLREVTPAEAAGPAPEPAPLDELALRVLESAAATLCADAGSATAAPGPRSPPRGLLTRGRPAPAPTAPAPKGPTP